MAQVAAAKQIIEKGLPFTPGMKISFLVQNAQKSPMLVRAWFKRKEKVTPMIQRSTPSD